MPLRIPVGRLSGRALTSVAALTRQGPLKKALAVMVRAELGIDAVRGLGRDARGWVPFSLQPRRARADHARASSELELPRLTGWPRSVREITEAYRNGKATPVTLVAKSIAGARALADRKPSLGPFLRYAEERARHEALASAERWARGAPLGELDGVPIAVKEEMDVAGFATRLGTKFMSEEPAKRDSVFVERLRAAGAIVVGQTPMTEYGLSPLGVNAHRTMPRNAHDASRLAGGSSTGSAVAVAFGVVPLALGTDGGGSVRTPAAYNGVFGLKPTYGRIAVTGHGMPGGTSVVHFGHLGSTSHELALGGDLAFGPDAGDPPSLAAPPFERGSLVKALGRGVKDLSIGVPEAEWSRADDEVASAGKKALDALVREGARLVPIELSLAAHAAAIGYLTIAVEARAALREVERTHWDDLGSDLKVFLSGVDGFVADDYVDAQRLREKLREQAQAALRAVDVIALPTTASTAPTITDAEARSGIIDTVALDAACRFAFLGNLTGLPAASAPVGKDGAGLPIGLQILGDAWDEACVLQVVAHLERVGVASSPKPRGAIDLLG
ncbi:MAG TPA: amidase [Polyangiaceae bacterium]|nr:amidase [Polyangiaceae bacterium]